MCVKTTLFVSAEGVYKTSALLRIPKVELSYSVEYYGKNPDLGP